MKTLLLSVMTVSLSGGAIRFLSPEGKLQKPITFAISLVICGVLLSPLLSLMGQEIDLKMTFPSISLPEEEAAGEALITMTAETICRDLEKEVALRYGIREASLSLTLDTRDREAIEIVSGILRGEGEGDMAAAYLADLLGCPITFEPSTKEESRG